VAAAIDPARYAVIPIGITRQGEWVIPLESQKVLKGGALQIPANGFSTESRGTQPLGSGSPEVTSLSDLALDVVFPVLHGPYGEDGTVQGFLELADIPYVGSGVLGSAVGMDKQMMKVAFEAAGLPVAPWGSFDIWEWRKYRDQILDRSAELGFPIFTKPANMGSSVGISRCADKEALAAGIELAFGYDTKVVVEQGLSAREIECGVLGNEAPEASLCGEIFPGREFYDYEAKYSDSSSSTVVPADLPQVVSDTIRDCAVRAFKAVSAAGLARVDFFYEEGGRGILINEINTIPGFTEISMFPKMWEATGIAYGELIDRLIELAFARHASKLQP
jgi:D-alanine-D-alanine ligase